MYKSLAIAFFPFFTGVGWMGSTMESVIWIPRKVTVDKLSNLMKAIWLNRGFLVNWRVEKTGTIRIRD